MRRLSIIIGAACAAALAACSTISVKQTAEKADTDASLAYAAIATTLNAYEARSGVTAAQTSAAEALKLKAWQALLVERQAYAASGAVDLTTLSALAAQAQA